MKRSTCLSLGLAGLAALGVYVPTRPSRAQEVPKDDMRYEVTASIGKLVDAANRADVAAVTAMISEKPEATIIADGEVYQGPTDIRANAERLLGQRGNYVFQLGPLAVANAHGMAVATGPYTLRPGGGQTVSARGAVTFLMERAAHRRWVVVHMHRSSIVSKIQID